VVLPPNLAAAYDQGQFQHVPMIIGTTRDEAKLFTYNLFKVDNEQRFRMMLQSDPDAPPKFGIEDVLKPYLLPSLTPALYNVWAWIESAVLGHAVNGSIARVAKYEPRVYAYRFDWDRGPEPWKTLYGAAHAIDLPFIFANFGPGFFAMDFSAQNRPGREALSKVMMQSIGAFMRSGNPNVPALGLDWKPWGADGEQRKLILDAGDQGLNLSLR
jgi:para-nitrobenzyl esterase